MSNIIFDYRLGYVRGNCSLPGFDVIGKDGAPRILALGGYTTPEQAKSGLSWVNCLYELFEKAGRPVQIINGDTDGFTTAQQLMMFIRDGILLKPEIVICLSGFYNFAYKLGFVKEKEYIDTLKNYPFTNLKQLEFHKQITSRFGLGNDRMYYGEQTHTFAWEYWLEHVDIINCLSEEFGMRHMTFLQPCIFSEGYNLSLQEELYIMKEYDITYDELIKFQNDFRMIYKNIENKNYITDIAGLYNKFSNAYIDACHVKDNHINAMAEAIYEHISEWRVDR